MAKKITFVLPGVSHKIVGGYKVVYELANRFCRDEYAVEILYIVPIKSITALLVNLRNGIFPKKSESINVSWFDIDKRIIQKFLPFSEFNKRSVAMSDYYIATSYKTAQWLGSIDLQKGKKIYFIQHFENWSGNAKEVEDTWKATFDKKIVIASWMIKKAKELRQEVHYWQMGIDFQDFYLEKPIEERDPNSIALMYHQYDWKGFQDGLQAIEIVKKKYGNVNLHLFSTFNFPEELQKKYQCFLKPNMRKLYNENSIYLAPSWTEGCHLPPLEAMACGCCVVATNVGSIPDFTIHGKTALQSEPKNPENLAENLIIALKNQEKRIAIAKEGHQSIQQYTWERAFQNFKKLVES